MDSFENSRMFAIFKQRYKCKKTMTAIVQHIILISTFLFKLSTFKVFCTKGSEIIDTERVASDPL